MERLSSFALLLPAVPHIRRDLPIYEMLFEKHPPLLPRIRDQQLAEQSNHYFLQSLQAPQSSIKAIHCTIPETQLTSKSSKSFPLFQSTEIRFHWVPKSFHSQATYLLLSLIFVMNTGSCSNPH